MLPNGFLFGALAGWEYSGKVGMANFGLPEVEGGAAVAEAGAPKLMLENTPPPPALPLLLLGPSKPPPAGGAEDPAGLMMAMMIHSNIETTGNTESVRPYVPRKRKLAHLLRFRNLLY
jgi:hypothetical protein